MPKEYEGLEQAKPLECGVSPDEVGATPFWGPIVAGLTNCRSEPQIISWCHHDQ
jgi:hypothetical protein